MNTIAKLTQTTRLGELAELEELGGAGRTGGAGASRKQEELEELEELEEQEELEEPKQLEELEELEEQEELEELEELKQLEELEEQEELEELEELENLEELEIPMLELYGGSGRFHEHGGSRTNLLSKQKEESSEAKKKTIPDARGSGKMFGKNVRGRILFSRMLRFWRSCEFLSVTGRFLVKSYCQ